MKRHVAQVFADHVLPERPGVWGAIPATTLRGAAKRIERLRDYLRGRASNTVNANAYAPRPLAMTRQAAETNEAKKPRQPIPFFPVCFAIRTIRGASAFGRYARTLLHSLESRMTNLAESLLQSEGSDGCGALKRKRSAFLHMAGKCEAC